MATPLRRFAAAMLLLPFLAMYSGVIHELHHEAEGCDDGCTQLARSQSHDSHERESKHHCERCVFCNTLTFSFAAPFDAGALQIAGLTREAKYTTPESRVQQTDFLVLCKASRAPPSF